MRNWRLGLVVLVVVGSVTCLAAGGPTFPEPLIVARDFPGSIAAGHLDGDGHLDLVVTNNFLPDHAVMFGAGDGTFGLPIDFGVNTGVATRSAGIADFDGDGLGDVVTADLSNDTLTLYLGNGDGTFAAGTFIPVADFANYLVIGDFDGNGTADIAVTVLGNDGVSLLLGDGNGGFTHSTLTVGNTPYGIVSGDLDGDLDLDLIVANRFSNSVSVLLGDGNGSFAPQVQYPTGDGPDTVTLDDFNEDGWLDVAVLNAAGGDLSLRLGTGTGVLGAETRLSAGVDASFIGTFDWNGDGHADLIVPKSEDNEVAVLEGEGSGSFGPVAMYPTCAGPRQILVARLDDDARDDMLVRCIGSGHLSSFAGAGGGIIPPTESRWPVGGLPWGIRAGDLDGDGDADLVVTNLLTDDISALINLGDASFASEIRTGVGSQPSDVGLGDFDEDGDLDAVVVNSNAGNVTILIGNGDGTFAAQPTIATGPLSRSVAVADLDNDLHLDIAVGTADATTPDITVLWGAGDGTFTVYTQAVPEPPYAIVAAQIDVGEFADLLVVNRGADQIMTLANVGIGSFFDRPPTSVGDDPWALAVGDLNHDGAIDAVVVNNQSNDISVLFGDNGWTFPPEQRLGPFRRPQSVAIADFDGDGNQDIAVGLFGEASAPGDAVVILPGLGDGTFAASESYRTGLAPRGLAVLDVELDGKLDLAVSDWTDDDVTLLVNAGPLPPVLGVDSDKATLRWGPVFGAVSYNTYRGDLSQLVDVDDNGLPDGGYGTCRNVFDPSLTDLTLTDVELPAPGDGYFYLAAWLDAGGTEKGIGISPAGPPRDPAPCP